MREITEFHVHSSSQEEDMPLFMKEYPIDTVSSRLNHITYPEVPWHWHRTCELFYIQEGPLSLTTPGSNTLMKKGCGGIVGANVLHKITLPAAADRSCEYIQQFLPEFISGSTEGQIYRKYYMPFLTSGIEAIILDPEVPSQATILQKIKATFDIDETVFGYEIMLRDALSEIWLDIMSLSDQKIASSIRTSDKNEKLRTMMIYIQQNFSQDLSVKDIGDSAFCSERECFRIFSSQLHMTPAEYLRSYRLNMASELLFQSDEAIADIAWKCGLGSNSHFGHLFRQKYGMSPREYRQLR